MGFSPIGAAVSLAVLLPSVLMLRWPPRGPVPPPAPRPLCGVPVPMALAPVIVFLATAAWLGTPWIAVAALVLAAGHVPASVLAARALADSP